MVVSGCGRSDRREIPTASHKSKGKGRGPDAGDLLHRRRALRSTRLLKTCNMISYDFNEYEI
jgi:hypothetical protein